MLEGVILAGGRGERFWPLSRRARPKQLLGLLEERSLLRATWDRLRARLDTAAIRVVASADLEPAIRAELPELGAAAFVGEPSGRNTAPACGVAAALGRAGGADPLQLVVPADHWIPATGDFWRDADTALALAAAADAPLVTLGIPVRRPETGYGYIERGAPRPEAGGCFRVARFHEKPDAATAQAYAASGGHYWNSGIFAWRAGALLEEIDRHLPELGRALEPLRRSPVDRGALPAVFGAAPAISIDHGVLERSGRVAVVAAGFAWNDVGNWSSWAEQLPADAAGNVGRGARVSLDAQGCVVYSDSGLVATLGVRDLVVVRSGDVTLVVERSRCQEIRRLLDAMRGDAELKGYL